MKGSARLFAGILEMKVDWARGFFKFLMSTVHIVGRQINARLQVLYMSQKLSERNEIVLLLVYTVYTQIIQKAD